MGDVVTVVGMVATEASRQLRCLGESSAYTAGARAQAVMYGYGRWRLLWKKSGQGPTHGVLYGRYVPTYLSYSPMWWVKTLLHWRRLKAAWGAEWPNPATNFALFFDPLFFSVLYSSLFYDISLMGCKEAYHTILIFA